MSSTPERWPIIRSVLEAAVPLRVLELRHHDVDDLMAWMERNWPHEDRAHVDAVDGITQEQAGELNALPPYRDPWVLDTDELMYGTGQRHREAMRRLINGLAIAIIVSPGGVNILDMHLCRDHNECLEAAA